MLRRIGSALQLSETNEANTIDLARLESADLVTAKSSQPWSFKNFFNMSVSKKQLVLGGTITFLIILMYLFTNKTASNDAYGYVGHSVEEEQKILSTRTVHRLAVVTDLDFDSKDNSEKKTFWKSFMRYMTLTRDPNTGKYSIKFDSPDNTITLRTRLNLDDRGMELSWLARFNNVLFSGDDRAGVIYSIDGKKAHARYVLSDGDGNQEKGFKSEWATVKDGALFVGSFGKEWSNEKGEILNNNPQWIKVIDSYGHVTHVDWTRPYEALRTASGYSYPGYLFHEAAAWNPTFKKWVFVPRRASKEKYNPDDDELMGTNLIITADASFDNVEYKTIDVALNANGVNPKGYSEIKFVPGQPRDIIALRSMEHQGVTKSWISVFDMDGRVLMEDVFIDDFKFEGLEFVD